MAEHQDARLWCYGAPVRTTVRIDDELYRAVKAQAARSGRTIGEVIEDAVRTALRTEPPERTMLPLPTYGGSGVMPGVDLASNAALADAMDQGTAADALR